MPKISLNASKKTKRTPAGEIPVDWGCSKFARHITIKHGYAFDSKWFSKDGKYVLLTPGSFHEAGGYRDQGEKTKYYTGQIPKGYILGQGDLLLAMTEQAEGLLGSALRVPASDRFLHNQRLGLVVLNSNSSLILEYIYWLYNYPEVRRIISASSSGTKVHHTSPSKLLDIDVPVPPLPEQRKIADILSTWDEALETLDALIAAKDCQKQALMQQLLTGKTRVKGFDTSGGKTKSDRFGVYPADWKKVALSDIIDEVSARNAGGKDLPVLSCTKHRGLVLSQEYFGKRVHAEDTSGYRVVRRGEFAYATNHIEEGSIGYQNLVDVGLVSPIYTVFRTKGEIDDNYLFRVLKSPLLIHFYQINTSASVDRRGSLRFDEFSRIRIWIPSKPEQLAIATILDTADQELTLLHTQRQTLDQQKRGLMQQLLTGKTRVTP